MSVIDNVEIRPSTITGAGDGIFAKKTFAPGDIILSLARPLVTELDKGRLDDTCAWCCSRAATDPHERASSRKMGLPAGFTEVKACTGCNTIKYCSKACQSKAWKLEHKHECKVLAVPNRPPLPHGVRATLKLLRRLQADDKAVKEVLRFAPKFDAVRKADPDTYDDYCTLAYGAWKYADEPSKANLDVARHLFFAVNCNALTLSTPLDDVSLGIGFDPLVCRVNHSCDPNAFFIFNCPQAVLRASRPVAKGEEIFIKYRDGTNPFTIRQAELKESYYFDCTCAKCAKGVTLREDAFAKPIESLNPEWCRRADELMKKQGASKASLFLYRVGGDSSEAERRMTALQTEAFKPWQAMRTIKTQYHGAQPGTGVADLKAALRLCLESGMWPLTRQPVPHLLRALFAAYTAAGDVDRALHVGLKKHFVVDPVIAPQPFWFEHLIDSWALTNVATTYSHPSNQDDAGALARKGCDTRMLFLGLLMEVWENLPKSYGRQSQLGGVVNRVWRTCVGEFDEPPKELREQVRQAWPGLKAYAEKIDVLSL
ncbi:hypothetical protein LTR36_008882 [Oleoguttula mirabilis]|uniref:Suppressor of anucleate metulae protein B n=1 Tax=Oleoguttula mirabilis TaxID=1507867 RepID=A0AAV9J7D5_9PEZI|nr:hypothetical protein LTR36_008882 [Oleoguttula mirabilis]